MFPFNERKELVFGTRTNTTVCQQDHNILFVDDLIVDYSFDPLINNSTIDFSSAQKQENKKKLGARDQREKEIKRAMHRDIERKRREEMSKLYDSLRSLLPLEHKGKLSMSDHMQEAVNYTKQLEKNVQELRTRRDSLRKLSIISETKSITSPNGNNQYLANSLTLNQGQDGMEILISSSTKGSEIRLSRVIKELHGMDLNVINCVSTKTNGRFLHKIQAEATDMRLIDVSVLQVRLTEVIN